jgi:hypothetical protein
MPPVRRHLRPGLLPLEIALFAAIFWGDEAGYVPLSKTPFLFLVAWGSLWLRGPRWRDVGLRMPEGWLRIAALGVAWGIAMWLLEFFVTMPLRAAEFLGSGQRAWVLALVIVNVAFGLAHLYQGPSGVIQATVGGVLLGVLYLVTGRNLLAPILAHGLGNSIDFTVMYFGLYPGVG